jgi:hypothetical protein
LKALLKMMESNEEKQYRSLRSMASCFWKPPAWVKRSSETDYQWYRLRHFFIDYTEISRIAFRLDDIKDSVCYSFRISFKTERPTISEQQTMNSVFDGGPKYNRINPGIVITPVQKVTESINFFMVFAHCWEIRLLLRLLKNNSIQ